MNLIEDVLKAPFRFDFFYTVRRKYFFAKETLFGYPYLKKLYFKKTGHSLNLKSPKRYTEKINWKKLYDRNPLIPYVTNKLTVRDYVTDVLGKTEAEKILIPLLYKTTDSSCIPFEKLPDEFVIKPNNAAGKILIVDNINNIKKEQIRDICEKWQNKIPYGMYKHEWAYQKIKLVILFEKLMRDERNDIPVDYKFYMFHGKCEMVSVHFNRRSGKQAIGYFSPEPWYMFQVKDECNLGPEIERPKNLNKMISVSEKLATPFDFIRVDLYSIREKVYFGELTNYPDSGFTPFQPVSFDYKLGEKWNLEPEYWKNSM